MYKTNAELPEAVRDALSGAQQTLWREAFDAAMAAGHNEEECAKIAWAAAKKSAEDFRCDAIERIEEAAALVPIAADAEGWKWAAEILHPGASRNADAPTGLHRYYPAEFTRAAAPAFENADAYINHAWTGAPDFLGLVGDWHGVNTGQDGVMRGELRLLESEDALRQKLLARAKAGKEIPVSINAYIAFDRGTRDGRPVMEARRVVTDLPRSIDLVSRAGAGGRILRAVASADEEALLKAARETFVKPQNAGGGAGEIRNPQSAIRNSNSSATRSTKGATMETTDPNAPDNGAIKKTQEQLATMATTITALEQKVTKAEEAATLANARNLLNDKLASSKLPAPAIALVRDYFDGRVPEAEGIDARIAKVRESFAAMLANNPARTTGGAVVQVGLESIDKMHIALARMFGLTHEWAEEEYWHRGNRMRRMVRGAEIDKSIAPFPGIRKAYEHWTGDADVSGNVRPENIRRITEEWNNSSFPYAVNNVMNKRLVQDYRAVDYGLEPLYDVAAAPNFKAQQLTRIGYLADLDTVDPEAADYAEIAAPTEDHIGFTVVQKGNIITITRKMIINDDLRVIDLRLSRLARSAARTLAQVITTLMETNAAIYDTVVWFHAVSHGNTNTTALSAAAVLAVRVAFRNFSEKDSLKKLNLGLDGAYLMVPTALAETALSINQQEYATNNLTDRNMARWQFGANNERIIVNPLLSDADDWAVFGNKSILPYLEVAFLDGRQDPDFAIQDNPTVDKVFTSDKIRMRVRHEYVPYVTDFRNVYWQEV